jgi:SH2 domain
MLPYNRLKQRQTQSRGRPPTPQPGTRRRQYSDTFFLGDYHGQQAAQAAAPSKATPPHIPILSLADDESNLLLQSEPPGTRLYRTTASRPNQFVISYVYQDTLNIAIRHVTMTDEQVLTMTRYDFNFLNALVDAYFAISPEHDGHPIELVDFLRVNLHKEPTGPQFDLWRQKRLIPYALDKRFTVNEISDLIRTQLPDGFEAALQFPLRQVERLISAHPALTHQVFPHALMVQLANALSWLLVSKFAHIVHDADTLTQAGFVPSQRQPMLADVRHVNHEYFLIGKLGDFEVTQILDGVLAVGYHDIPAPPISPLPPQETSGSTEESPDTTTSNGNSELDALRQQVAADEARLRQQLVTLRKDVELGRVPAEQYIELLEALAAQGIYPDDYDGSPHDGGLSPTG